MAFMLSCNSMVLNYTIVMYNKYKVKIVQEIANKQPKPLVVSYFLYES